MSGDDQERFEDYLELESYIEELQAGRAAHPPAELTPSKARIYRMAALFRSAAPGEASPRPEFAAELQARLEQELESMRGKDAQPLEGETNSKPQELPGPRHSPFHARQPQKKPYVSRRALLAGGAAAAASLVAGVGIGSRIESSTQSTSSTAQWSTPIVPSDAASTWHFVTALAQLGDNAIRFTTDTIVGYVIYSDGDDSEKPGVVAFSAACTHMGCIVQWQASDRKYHCPCHGGLFSEYGKPDGASAVKYLTALPRLETKVENGNVYVKVPTSKQ